MIKKWFVLISIIFPLWGCNTQNEENENFARINIEISTNEDIEFSNIRFLNLETNTNNLFSNIYKLKITENRIYILTNMPISGLYIFNKKGKFIFKIDNYGRGPGEFYMLEDLYVNEEKGIIEVYDIGNQKNLFYDFNGNFIKEWKHNLYFSNFQKNNNGNYFLGTEYTTNVINDKLYSYNLLILDSNKQIISTHSYFDEKKSEHLAYAQYNNFYKFKGKLNFIYAMCDTIFYIKDDLSVTPRYLIDFQKNTLPRKLIEKYYDDVIRFNETLQKTNYAYHINNLGETKDLVMFNFKCQKSSFLSIYSKNSKKVKFGDKLIFDFDGFKLNTKLTAMLSAMHFVDNNEVVFIIEPVVLKKWLKEIVAQNKSLKKKVFNNSELVKTIKKLNTNDNPVFMYCKLDDF